MVTLAAATLATRPASALATAVVVEGAVDSTVMSQSSKAGTIDLPFTSHLWDLLIE